MFKRIGILTLLLIAAGASADVSSYFSPYAKCEPVILQQLSCVHRSVLISCYGLTNQPIATQLLKLHRQGVTVIICVDKLQAAGRSDQTHILKAAGIPVIVKKSPTLEHNKLMILDHETVLTGSWNFSASADLQDNTLLVITHDAPTVQAFEDAWKRIFTRDGGPADLLPMPTVQPEVTQ
jgi:phosphatidylserine/phosphatidylglycerophosphate/cardiolipin synthase-like enzyme